MARRGSTWTRVLRSASALLVVGAVDLVVRQPRWAASLAAVALGGVLVDVPTRRRAVALTFDDGPHPAVTPALLDVLARNDAAATFFLTGGAVAGNEEIVQRIVDEGHELGIHGMDATPSASRPTAAFEDDVVASMHTLSPWAPVRYLRPASGWIRPDQLAVVRRHGLTCALGSVTLVRDPVGHPWLAARLLGLRARPGAIVVLHEGSAARRSIVPTVDHLLSSLAGSGYAALTLSDLEAVRHGPPTDAGPTSGSSV